MEHVQQITGSLDEIPLEQLRGIGPESKKHLEELGVHTIFDLLEFFPTRYEDLSLTTFEEMKHNEKVTIQGEVISLPMASYFGKKSRCNFKVKVEHCIIKVTLFNQNYVKGTIELGDEITISGKWDANRLSITGQFIGKVDPNKNVTYKPVYPLKGLLPQASMKKWVLQALEAFQNDIIEIMPEHFIHTYRIPNKQKVYSMIHNPMSQDDLKHARRRIIYEELLLFQLRIQLLRKKIKETTIGVEIHTTEEEIQSFIGQTLPFKLTGAQSRVIGDIIRDLNSPYLMNRLLQGDVGSGKTIVAATAAYGVVKSGHQVAIMVPTEILAEQHFETFVELFRRTTYRVECLTSGTKSKKRVDVLQGLADGQVDIIVGTHALLQERVQFHKIGLVITDEQHRFGVEQRKALREKGKGKLPNVLHMTATPIPRTLAITAFGEMDVSTIDELPKGRKPIVTKWAKLSQVEKVWEFATTEVNKGRQVYVICPLIEESEKLDLQNAYDLYNELTEQHFRNQSVGLLHGRMSQQEKDEGMKAFKQGQIQILVSTTVIEVGVNVPNASVMIIYDAQRFGLAQLHQLRGRVGRGSEQSYCILLGDPKTEIGKERLSIMTETNDGFEIAERDLQLRGPGDLFGAKQSGMPEFKMANLIHDYRALEVARKDAVHMVETGVYWTDVQYEPLRNHVENQLTKQDGIFD